MERSGGLILDTSSFVTAVKNHSVELSQQLLSLSTTSFVDKPRNLVDEMDFFSDDKKKRLRGTSADDDLKVPTMSKKDNSITSTVNTGLHLHMMSDDRSVVYDGSSTNKREEDMASKNELASIQAELGQMKEENERLKSMLSEVTSNYNSLRMQLVTITQRKNPRLSGSPPQKQEVMDEKLFSVEKKQAFVSRQFMDLGPIGSNTNDSRSSERSNSPHYDIDKASMDYRLISNGKVGNDVVPNNHGGIKSGSMIREESPEQVDSQGWIPNKTPKLSSPSKDPEQGQEATMRKVRVLVRAQSEAPMITDGCQWRKYGQKMAKGNPCPRAYYRCTMAAGCPVRKQVQRCADDRTILITTYEGKHNHPLPPAAMAMVSTTSAAATMLLSGSMSSTAKSILNPNFLGKGILPCSMTTSSMATISASTQFPTVTLDLTNSPVPLQFQRPPASPRVFGQSLYDQSKLTAEQKPMLQLADTVSAATAAAITVDPTFTAALAAAITSIISNGGGNGSSSDHQNRNNSDSNISGSNKEDNNS